MGRLVKGLSGSSSSLSSPLLQLQTHGTQRKLSSPRTRWKPSAARTEGTPLLMDKRIPLRLPTTLRTTPTRPSATGRSRCLLARRFTSGASPLMFSKEISSGSRGCPPRFMDHMRRVLARSFLPQTRPGGSRSSSGPTRGGTLVASDASLPLLLPSLGLDLDLAPPLDPALAQPQELALVPAVSLIVGLPPALLAFSLSTTWASPTLDVPPSMETPLPGAPPRLTPTMTMSLVLVPGDTAMPLAPFKRQLLPPRPQLPPLLQDLSSLLLQELASAA